MSTRSTNRDERRRAEARRRARLAARGELPEDEDEPDAVEAPASSGGFLTRLFPPAPPLPGRPDPFAGFDRTGPVRPIRERAFLLSRNLLAWVVTGVLVSVGYLANGIYGNSILGLIANFVMFGALIAAGWFGWQRPTLYGTAAGLLSFVLLAGYQLVWFAQRGAPPETFGTEIFSILLSGAYLGGLGFLGGWYGGYLRRRQAQLSAQVRRRR